MCESLRLEKSQGVPKMKGRPMKLETKEYLKGSIMTRLERNAGSI
jgi:hypothetical protein